MNSRGKIWRSYNEGRRVCLLSPTALPKASGFLWTREMMTNVNCRGFVSAQFMQPEPSKYSFGPNIEATTFMQPEQAYYQHHPGRFFYIQDLEDDAFISLPYEPTRHLPDRFIFVVEPDRILWRIRWRSLVFTLSMNLLNDAAGEHWVLDIENRSAISRKLKLMPCFSFGYMSWMNQSACCNEGLGALIASYTTPYQKLEDYLPLSKTKQKTFFLYDQEPQGYETRREVFEGEGGLTRPDGLFAEPLENGDAHYETPIAAVRYDLTLGACETTRYRFLFGAAHGVEEIRQIRLNHFESPHAKQSITSKARNEKYRINTPDAHLDLFFNTWLQRQVRYHGETNRLTTDPQTRNYLQDASGMAYIDPQKTRVAISLTLSQQGNSGAIPDGVLLHESATLKYINQIPHLDHPVWLPIALDALVNQTGDLDFLDQKVPGNDSGEILSVRERVNLALDWLAKQRDDRGLCLMAQGDWCDPMNMVGPKGKGVSGWLSMAFSYALQRWSALLRQKSLDSEAKHFGAIAGELNTAVNIHLWDGRWYARGITDGGRVFGSHRDQEGAIFLNTQSWAILAGIPDDHQQALMITAIEEKLITPYGPMLLAPAFTRMHEDIGRVTQKFPGSAENGSVYNHAAAFYIFSLFSIGEPERAVTLLHQMIPGESKSDLLQRGQLPVFIPNYYRGAFFQIPETAGRSSQLFNTGSAAWYLRCVVECLLGVHFSDSKLTLRPQMPKKWEKMSCQFRHHDKDIHIVVERNSVISEASIEVNGIQCDNMDVFLADLSARNEIKVYVPGSMNPIT